MRAMKLLFLLICIIASVICDGKDDFYTATTTTDHPRQRAKTTFEPYNPDLGGITESVIEGSKTGNGKNKTSDVVDGICQSVDIRNDLENLNGIEDCVVIEGYLRIIQVNHTNGDDIGKLTFPKLREITGYLLLYKVDGLTSLANVFPNLEVIRGHHTINGHAIMVFEMPNLQELGLDKLTAIGGGVRIENNANLCYVETVDWNFFVPADSEIIIKHNKAGRSCPGCPTCVGGHCWTSNQCQDTVKPRCHSECLGSCHGIENTECSVCKHYRHDGQCLAECPMNLYGYLSRRCVTEKECLTMSNTGSKNEYGSNEALIWRSFNGSCIMQCPDGFEDHGSTCRACSGPCQRVIRNTSDAQFHDGLAYSKEGQESYGENLPNELYGKLYPNGKVNPHQAKKGEKYQPSSKDQEIVQKTKNDTNRKGGYNGNLTPVVTVDGICTSVDIRNTVDNFKRIEDCVIIEGFLQIVLIDRKDENSFENVTLPKLREITGYLLLYRVNGLKSLTNLFPNLEVIRGQDLLTDYALMVYEMPNLQELGLTKLVEISRGGVRIEKNPTLCFVDTVDWKRIATSPGAHIYHMLNKQRTGCPGCPKCDSGHCWTSKHCQAVEKPKCHSECLGLCFGIEDTACNVCKHYRHEGKCIPKCPEHLYGYLSRRCITQAECVGMKRPSPPNGFGAIDVPSWRPFKGYCITSCPSGYEDFTNDQNIKTCKPCTGPCKRVLGGETIRNLADAQRYKGINIVQGGLEFHLDTSNNNMMQELETSFEDVEEITGYLKVMHSFPITSLSFFKKLKVIRGEPPENNNASLTVLDNPNLSNLFAKGQTVEIKNGRLFFHYNPKLCFSKIKELGSMSNITTFSNVEVDRESNGEKVACDIVEINITVSEKKSNSATLSWKDYVPSNGQLLLRYILNYMATENPNITVFDSNFCGNNTWQTIDVDVPHSNVSAPTIVSKTITGLKPYTSYAIYVKTYTSRHESISTSPVAQSLITFFRTQSDIPSPPTNLSSISASDTEIMLRWDPPEVPNGPIAYYLTSRVSRREDPDILEFRDYCKYGIIEENIEPVTDEPDIEVTTEKLIESDPEPCCMDPLYPTKCCKKRIPLPVPKPPPPKKFDIMCNANMSLSTYVPGSRSTCRSSGIEDFMSLVEFEDDKEFVVNLTAENSHYLVNNLTHYSMYTFNIVACGSKLADGTEQCSDVQYTSARTARREGADDVQNLEARVTNATTATVSWDRVRHPNGLTVSYTIEYSNLDVKDFKQPPECVPARNTRGLREKFDLQNLSPGRYKVRVRSTSLAGDGRFTNPVEFKIELEENSSTGVIVGLSIAIFAAIGIFAVCLLIKRRNNKMKQIRLIASVNPDYIETKYVADDWEVAREDVKVLEELGLGNFGMVYRGILNGSRKVAIKTISKTANLREKNEFLNEASVMKNFSTFHIIKLLGVVSIGNPPFVIMELMENGDLKTYLRKIRDTQKVPNFSRICRMAAEIADGMAYLESKKFVHRDLAARNCMISKDLVCKIGDFGMARDVYETDYYKIGKKGLLPIRWMAPENLSDGVFTSDSDVWSYGVVLYEILTLAEIPYQGFSNEEVLNFVLRKGTVDIPKNCPEVIYKITERCFKWRPNDRPTFLEIVSELEPFLSQDFCTASFYHSSDGVEIRNSGVKKVYHNAAPIRFYFGNETARWVKDFEDNVMLLDQTKAGSSRGRIFKNGFQQFGNLSAMEDVSLDR